jgi:uncharacterized membrane protein
MYVGLLSLSVIGLYISSYFTLVHYRIVEADSKYVPEFCRMDEGSCMLVIHHPDASIFGVPNALLGIPYYLSVLLLVVGVDGDPLLTGLRLSSLVTVVLGVYLVHSLFVKVRVMCLLCLTSHVINMFIAFLLLYY